MKSSNKTPKTLTSHYDVPQRTEAEKNKQLTLIKSTFEFYYTTHSSFSLMELAMSTFEDLSLIYCLIFYIDFTGCSE